MLKRFIQHIFVSFLLIFSLNSQIFAVDDFQIEYQTEVIDKALQIQQTGILKQKDNGYLYLEVSNDFIKEILPLIDAPGKIVPPRHYTSKKGIGAHISVMYENEQILNEIWEIKELGQEFTFTVMELRTVKLMKDNVAKKLWLIAVDAPELERLRMDYGLAPRLKNHNFHITIGTQVPGKSQTKIEQIDFKESFEEEIAA